MVGGLSVVEILIEHISMSMEPVLMKISGLITMEIGIMLRLLPFNLVRVPVNGTLMVSQTRP